MQNSVEQLRQQMEDLWNQNHNTSMELQGTVAERDKLQADLDYTRKHTRVRWSRSKGDWRSAKGSTCKEARGGPPLGPPRRPPPPP